MPIILLTKSPIILRKTYKMNINFFIPEQCLVYAGILLYVVIAIVFARHTYKELLQVYNYSSGGMLTEAGLFGIIWPIFAIGFLLGGIGMLLGAIFTLGMKKKEKPRF